jgi:hypothetical protein
MRQRRGSRVIVVKPQGWKGDTYCDYRTKGGDRSTIAGVGACKVSECEYNQSLECAAPGITVGRAQDEADCLTFEPA